MSAIGKKHTLKYLRVHGIENFEWSDDPNLSWMCSHLSCDDCVLDKKCGDVNLTDDEKEEIKEHYPEVFI